MHAFRGRQRAADFERGFSHRTTRNRLRQDELACRWREWFLRQDRIDRHDYSLEDPRPQPGMFPRGWSPGGNGRCKGLFVQDVGPEDSIGLGERRLRYLLAPHRTAAVDRAGRDLSMSAVRS